MLVEKLRLEFLGKLRRSFDFKMDGKELEGSGGGVGLEGGPNLWAELSISLDEAKIGGLESTLPHPSVYFSSFNTSEGNVYTLPQRRF